MNKKLKINNIIRDIVSQKKENFIKNWTPNYPEEETPLGKFLGRYKKRLVKKYLTPLGYPFKLLQNNKERKLTDRYLFIINRFPFNTGIIPYHFLAHDFFIYKHNIPDILTKNDFGKIKNKETFEVSLTSNNSIQNLMRNYKEQIDFEKRMERAKATTGINYLKFYPYHFSAFKVGYSPKIGEYIIVKPNYNIIPLYPPTGKNKKSKESWFPVIVKKNHPMLVKINKIANEVGLWNDIDNIKLINRILKFYTEEIEEYIKSTLRKDKRIINSKKITDIFGLATLLGNYFLQDLLAGSKSYVELFKNVMINFKKKSNHNLINRFVYRRAYQEAKEIIKEWGKFDQKITKKIIEDINYESLFKKLEMKLFRIFKKYG